MRRVLVLVLVGLPLCSPAESPLQRTTVIHAGTLISDAKGEVKSTQSIYIDGENIRAVEDGFVSPPGASVIDLSGSVVMPGLIDTHVHLQFSGATLNRDLAHMEDGVTTLRAYAEARRSLAAGFTTLRDMAGDPDVIFALRDAINSGIVSGPRILAAGPAIMPTGGGVIRGLRSDFMSMLETSNLEYPCDGADACRKAVRQLVKRGADHIKIVATASITAPGRAGFASQMTLAELTAIVETAHILDRKVAAHAHGLDGLNMALEAGVDSIEHGTFADRSSVKLFKKTGAWLVATPLDGLVQRAKKSNTMSEAQRSKILDAGEYWFRMTELSYKNGVRMAFGSDINVGGHGSNALKLMLFQRSGMSNADILDSATTAAATLLGLEKEIGSIAPGKLADIIASPANPLEDIEALGRVSFVMKSGEVID